MRPAYASGGLVPQVELALAGALTELEIVAAAGRPQDFGDRHRRHRDPIGCPLGFQPVAGLLLDQEVDQFKPAIVVDRFRQQLPVTMIVVARILFTHGTPRLRAFPEQTVFLNVCASATDLRQLYPAGASNPASVAELIRRPLAAR
jgi:hypothetical protein